MEQGENLIRQPEVLRISGLSRSEVWRRVGRGDFPAPVRLGERCTRWAHSEVQAWVNARLAERASQKAA